MIDAQKAGRMKVIEMALLNLDQDGGSLLALSGQVLTNPSTAKDARQRNIAT